MRRKQSLGQLVSAGGVVWRSRNGKIEVVICGRDSPKVWGLPKGTPHCGETHEQTALREVCEETGLLVEIDEFIEAIDYWFVRPTDRLRCHKTVYFYLMKAIGGDISQHDHEFDRVEWLPVGDSLKTLTYENEVGIVLKSLYRLSKKAYTIRKSAIRGQKVTLREKSLEDTLEDYTWRTDEELARLDATKPLKLSFTDFIKYSREEWEDPNPWSERLAIDTHDGKHIGNCMYYDIDFKRGNAELGIMIGDRDYWGKGYGTDSVRTLLNHIFTTTPLDRVYLHTLEWNHRARNSFTKAGFCEVKKLRRSGMDFILMEIRRPE